MFKALIQDFERQFLNAVEEDDVTGFNIALSLVEPNTSLSSFALRSAIEQNSLKVLPLLFEHNFQPADSNKTTLFTLAAEFNRKEALVLMSERWVLSQKDVNEAMLHAVSTNSSLTYTFLFEEMNADINYNNGANLFAAVTNLNNTVITFLLENSADITTLSKKTMEELSKEGAKGTVMLLLDAGADPTSYSHFPFPWLMEFLGYPDDMTPIDYLNHRDFDPQYRTICLNAITRNSVGV